MIHPRPMRIVQLTPGTGNFYCGSCLRDNALVTALRRQGQDALLLPLYLPHVVDEASAAAGTPLFFGGINVYLQQHYAVFRRTPAWLDRLLDARWLLRAAATRAGMTAAADLGEMTLSMLRGAEGGQQKELAKTIAWLREPAHRPDLICLSNGLLAGSARQLRAALGVPVVVTLQGEDLFLDGLPEPYRTAAWALLRAQVREASLLIAVSQYYRRHMAARLDLPESRLAPVPCGIALDGFPPPASAGAAPPLRTAPERGPTIGFLARMHPTKGLDRLVDAFVRLHASGRAPAGLRLRVAGTQTASDLPYVRQCQARLAAAGLAAAAEFLPNLDRRAKLAFLASLDLLSVPVTYGEAFGLYLLEAWAAGVPVVQPATGAFPELIAATGAGVTYDPARPEALDEALAALLHDPARRAELARRGPPAVHAAYSSDHMARAFLAACAPLLASPP